MKTRWTEKRLSRLFARYNRKYWRGRLPSYRVVPAALPGSILGQCHSRKRLIEIDVRKHSTDAQLRGTFLHEMAHAGVGARSNGLGHGVPFFGQVERLLQKGAPITIHADGGDAGLTKMWANLVPARFRLLKKKIDRQEAQRVRKIEALNLPVHHVTEAEIVSDFADAALELPWEKARFKVGLAYGLIDDTGRPLNAYARRVIAKGRRAHAQARRFNRTADWK